MRMCVRLRRRRKSRVFAKADKSAFAVIFALRRQGVWHKVGALALIFSLVNVAALALCHGIDGHFRHFAVLGSLQYCILLPGWAVPLSGWLRRPAPLRSAEEFRKEFTDSLTWCVLITSAGLLLWQWLIRPDMEW